MSVLAYEDGTGTNARFHCPRGIGIDTSNNLYAVEYKYHTVRMITPAGECSIQYMNIINRHAY